MLYSVIINEKIIIEKNTNHLYATYVYWVDLVFNQNFLPLLIHTSSVERHTWVNATSLLCCVLFPTNIKGNHFLLLFLKNYECVSVWLVQLLYERHYNVENIYFEKHTFYFSEMFFEFDVCSVLWIYEDRRVINAL